MQDSPKLPDPLLSDVQGVAALLGASPSTVRKLLRDDPSFPRPRALGRRMTRWSRAVVEAWIVSRPATHAAGHQEAR